MDLRCQKSTSGASGPWCCLARHGLGWYPSGTSDPHLVPLSHDALWWSQGLTALLSPGIFIPHPSSCAQRL